MEDIRRMPDRDIFAYLDGIDRWDMPNVVEGFKYLCNRYDVDYDAYETFDDLLEAIRVVMNEEAAE